jgi:hypothetical protein
MLQRIPFNHLTSIDFASSLDWNAVGSSLLRHAHAQSIQSIQCPRTHCSHSSMDVIGAIIALPQLTSCAIAGGNGKQECEAAIVLLHVLAQSDIRSLTELKLQSDWDLLDPSTLNALGRFRYIQRLSVDCTPLSYGLISQLPGFFINDGRFNALQHLTLYGLAQGCRRLLVRWTERELDTFGGILQQMPFLSSLEFQCCGNIGRALVRLPAAAPRVTQLVFTSNYLSQGWLDVPDQNQIQTLQQAMPELHTRVRVREERVAAEHLQEVNDICAALALLDRVRIERI